MSCPPIMITRLSTPLRILMRKIITSRLPSALIMSIPISPAPRKRFILITSAGRPVRELAKGDDSEFALEIVAIVEGVEDEDEYVPVRVTFDLNGGRWTDGIAAYVIKNGEPEANLTVTSLNDKTAKEYTLLNKQSMFYQ